MKKISILPIILLLISGSIFAIEDKKIEYNKNHPIVIDNELLGGFNNGKWITKENFKIRHKGKIVNISEINCERLENINIDLAKSGDKYKVYYNNKFIGIETGNNPNFTVDGYGNQIMEMNFRGYNGRYDEVTFICGEWNAVPREIKAGKIKEEYIVDIDGDGKDDKVLIKDSSWKEKSYDDEEYVVKGKEILLYKNGKKTVVTKFNIDGVYNAYYNIRIIDLNGDGTMEIVYVLSGHNTTYAVFEIKNGKAKKVLSNYIGD